ncbi:hypothetical protein N7509_002648 [Penicillium cosmopolitanum]|uniref:Uncharacterized protein n=1 Tax=Penicillium cosmopolitanum TaxID=1131564 RepID=A0A9X0BDN3_9EURO|nr:uncharacterized protein N7509_002648 [Penicillium cosmopolitanum]KAJ5408765.1 hypothetical protein N7509_002648 [Penicillium cosmopolitanum]
MHTDISAAHYSKLTTIRKPVTPTTAYGLLRDAHNIAALHPGHQGPLAPLPLCRAAVRAATGRIVGSGSLTGPGWVFWVFWVLALNPVPEAKANLDVSFAPLAVPQLGESP